MLKLLTEDELSSNICRQKKLGNRIDYYNFRYNITRDDKYLDKVYDLLKEDEELKKQIYLHCVLERALENVTGKF